VSTLVDASRHPLGVETLTERLQWIVENRGFGSMRQLSLQSGLSHGTIAAITRRERLKDDTDPDVETLTKIALTGKVSIDWLIWGRGSPDDTAGSRKLELVGQTDTKSMADEAVRLLQADGLQLGKALELVHRVKLQSPTARGYYDAAWKLLHTERGRPVVGERIVTEEFDGPSTKRTRKR